MLAGEAAQLYAIHTVPEVAEILDAPVPTVQGWLRDMGVMTAEHAIGLMEQGWSVEDIAREWGLHRRTVAAYLRRETV